MRALKDLLGVKPSIKDLNDQDFLKRISELQNNERKYQKSQVLNYIKRNLDKNPYKAYLEETYNGCSQECTNIP